MERERRLTAADRNDALVGPVLEGDGAVGHRADDVGGKAWQYHGAGILDGGVDWDSERKLHIGRCEFDGRTCRIETDLAEDRDRALGRGGSRDEPEF